MLSHILSALSLARHAVALTLIASAAATTMVAGAVDQTGNQPQHETAPMTSIAPTTKPEPTETSEVAPIPSAKSATPETTQKPTTSARAESKTGEVEALVKDCLTKYATLKTSTTAGAAASEACRRAIEATGLTSTEFWTRFAPKPQPSTAPVKPSTGPATNIEALVKDCFAKYIAAKDSTTGATAASEACHRAIEASGLSATEFWAKFGTPRATKPAPQTSAAPVTSELTQVTRYCLTLHAALTSASSHEQVERTTTVCNQAIAESKLTPAQFWAKFAAYH